MISLNIDIKESAYDKIIYLLSHLKDDVTIKTHPSVSKDIIIQDKNELKTLQKSQSVFEDFLNQAQEVESIQKFDRDTLHER